LRNERVRRRLIVALNAQGSQNVESNHGL
jgi:hypothetical protein